MRNLRAAAASASAAAAAYTAYATNERVVEQRASQLERLRDCAEHCGGYPRTAASHSQLASYDRPIVISGLLDAYAWPALGWSFAALRKRIGQALVDCGSSTGGVPFYLVAANSARPAGRSDLALYVFDSDFSDEKASLLADFTDENGDGLPALTSGDVFATGAAAEHCDRPVWRWLLAGPAVSGTLVHQDPWGYSSWNASLVGRKRWVLFPPSVDRETLHPPRTDAAGRLAALFGIALPRGAAAFMEEVLPSLRGRGLGEVELVQSPGEVVAFPAGWWHAVVNLDATLAVTESYGRSRDLESILDKLRSGGLGAFATVVEEEAALNSGEWW